MSGLKDLVDGIRKAESALGDGKKTVSEEEWITRKKYHSSIVSAQAIKRGSVITRNQLTIKNPGSGIPAMEIDSVLGKKAAIDIKEDVMILSSMVEKLP